MISHETIRQHLLQTEVSSRPSEVPARPVLFVEVDGLYIKRIKGREEKIVAVHEGWIVNEKRTKLKNKRHYALQGKEPFWEGFETFLIDTYNYDPTIHYLVINGDDAPWITACRTYFKNAFFVLDRFHVARDLKMIFSGLFTEPLLRFWLSLTIHHKRSASLIVVQSGDSGGSSATGKTPQARLLRGTAFASKSTAL